MVLYANSAVLICQAKSKHALKAKNKKELKNVKLWAASNNLFLSFDKIRFMLYSNISKPQPNDFVLEVDGKKLFPKTLTKYSGIILDKNLNWAEHCCNMSPKKLNVDRGIIYRLQQYLIPKLLKQV